MVLTFYLSLNGGFSVTAGTFMCLLLPNDSKKNYGNLFHKLFDGQEKKRYCMYSECRKFGFKMLN